MRGVRLQASQNANNGSSRYVKGCLNFFCNIKLWDEKRRLVQNQRSINDLEVLRLMAGSIQFEKSSRIAWFEKNHTDKVNLPADILEKIIA